MSAEQVYSKASSAVVCVLMETTGFSVNGTGFFVNDSGVVLTAYHVVRNVSNGKVQLADLTTAKITSVIAYDESLDLALLQTEAKNTPYLSFADSSRVNIGESVYTIGYPRAYTVGTSSPTFTSGMVSAWRKHSGVTYIQSTVDVTDGNSGGALLNSRGEVIGVVASSISIEGVDYMNLALPSNSAKGFVVDNV